MSCSVSIQQQSTHATVHVPAGGYVAANAIDYDVGKRVCESVVAAIEAEEAAEEEATQEEAAEEEAAEEEEEGRGAAQHRNSEAEPVAAAKRVCGAWQFHTASCKSMLGATRWQRTWMLAECSNLQTSLYPECYLRTPLGRAPR